MTMIKICGITDSAALETAAKSGATMAGFVFYKDSPRYIEPEKAGFLINANPIGIKAVGLFVNPSDDEITEAMDYANLDYIQLHGEEGPQRVSEIKELTGLPIIKAIRLGCAEDVLQAGLYATVTDWLLFDKKSGRAQGGTGETFDWHWLESFKSSASWMLSGGLSAENIDAALTLLSPDGIDVSSGVEDAPGQKNPEKIEEFIECAAAKR